MVYDWKNNKYISFSKKLRLFALNNRNNLIKNLTNSICYVKSRQVNLSNLSEERPFT